MQTVFQVIVEAAKQNALLTILLALLPTATGGLITIFQDYKNIRNEKRTARRDLYTEVREKLQEFLFQVNAQLTNLNNIQIFGRALSDVCLPLKNEIFLSHDIDSSDWYTTIIHLNSFCKMLFQNLEIFNPTDIMALFYIDFIKDHCFELLNPNLVVDMTTKCLFQIATPVRLIGGTLQIKEEELESFISELTKSQMRKANLWDIKERLVKIVRFVEDEIKKL